MIRRSSSVLIAALLLILGATAATAAPTPTSGTHFTRNNTPTCVVTDTGGATASALCTSEVAGLGEGDVLIETTVAGAAVYQCENQGGNQAPGQNAVVEGPVTAPVTLDGDELKNGRARLTGARAQLTAEDEVSAAAAGCPNNNWTGVDPEVSITSVTYSASQGGVTIFECTRTSTTALSGTITFTDDECSGTARF